MHAPVIDGNTKLIGIAGHPIAQVLTPIVLTGLLRHNAINAICVPFHVEPASFPALLAGVRSLHNLLGVIATVPHKQAAAAVAGTQSPRARLIRAPTRSNYRTLSEPWPCAVTGPIRWTS